MARDYFEQQAQYGRRVIFRWRAPRDWSDHAAIVAVRGTDEFIEGVHFETEVAARAFDLDRVDYLSFNGPEEGPWVQFPTWADAERWLRSEE